MSVDAVVCEVVSWYGTCVSSVDPVCVVRCPPSLVSSCSAGATGPADRAADDRSAAPSGPLSLQRLGSGSGSGVGTAPPTPSADAAVSGVVAAGTRAGVAGAAGALAVAPPALGSATTASQRASADVSQRLNRRLMLRRVFMQLQSKPGDKGEQVSRAQFRDALASNAAVMAFLGDGKLLQQVAVRSGWLLWP